MTTKINFTLKFAEHKMEIVFNPADDAKFYTIGQNSSHEATAFLNAIGEVINVNGHKYLQGQDAGLYLHQLIEDAAAFGMPVENLGYGTSIAAKKLIWSGVVSYRRDDVMPGQVYQFAFNGMTAYCKMLNPKTYSEDEWDGADRIRNAYDLVKNSEILRNAERNNVNIRLIYTDKRAPRFALMQEQWNLFLAGKFDELAENIKSHILNGGEKKAMYKAGKKAEKDGFVAPVAQLGTLMDYVGKNIQFQAYDAKRGWLTLDSVYAVTDENLPALAYVLKNKGYQIVEVSEAVVPVVYESKAPKARKTAKAVAA